MRKPFINLSVIICIVVGFTSCNFFTQNSVPSGSIIMTDDFSIDEGNWRTTIDADHSMVGYQVGGMRFVINAPQKDYFSLYKTPYTHAILDVDAEKLAGPDNNVMGIVCRYQDIDNYYGFLISSDGYYGIVSKVEGDYHILTDGQMHYNADVIHTGEASNHIHVSCVSNALWIEVNGKVLASLYDDALTEGQVGLIAGTVTEPGVDILFDNFTVTQP